MNGRTTICYRSTSVIVDCRSSSYYLASDRRVFAQQIASTRRRRRRSRQRLKREILARSGSRCRRSRCSARSCESWTSSRSSKRSWKRSWKRAGASTPTTATRCSTFRARRCRVDDAGRARRRLRRDGASHATDADVAIARSMTCRDLRRRRRVERRRTIDATSFDGDVLLVSERRRESVGDVGDASSLDRTLGRACGQRRMLTCSTSRSTCLNAEFVYVLPETAIESAQPYVDGGTQPKLNQGDISNDADSRSAARRAGADRRDPRQVRRSRERPLDRPPGRARALAASSTSTTATGC